MDSLVFRVICLLYVIIWTIGPRITIAGEEDTRNLRVLVTSDLHGWMSTALVYPEQKRKGLLHIRDHVIKARSQDPEVILLDAGDLLQGSPLVSFFHQTKQDPARVDPFFRLFLSLRYDAVAVGNHDLGINPLLIRSYLPRSNFSWLAANVKSRCGQVFKPYIMIERYELKIAVIGFTTPGSQMWMGDRQLSGLLFQSIASSATDWLKILEDREQPDLVIGLFHSGISQLRDDENSKLNRVQAANDVAETLRRNKGFDLVIVGHDHYLSPYRTGMTIRYLTGTPIVQGGRWGEALLDLALTVRRADQQWKIERIAPTVVRSSQNLSLEAEYRRQLPEDYLRYIYEPLPYVFRRADKKTILNCLNQLNAMAQLEPGIAGTLLPRASITRLTDFIDKRICRQDLYKWFRHDNRTITVNLSLRDIHLLRHPEAEFGRRWIPGNRRLFPYFVRPVVAQKNRSWWLDRNRFKRTHPVKISDYHFHGGGGIIAQIFLDKQSKPQHSAQTTRERFFAFLQTMPVLPYECRFLEFIEEKDSKARLTH